jgi:flagella basal body P-ring formation protein FlgA
MRATRSLLPILLLALAPAGARVHADPAPATIGAAQILRAVELQVRAQLEDSALARGANGVEVEAGALDSRLQLAACPTPLDVNADLDRPSGRLNARVDCRGANPWSIYVPVTIRVFRDVVVSTAPLERGQPIGPGDVTLEERDALANGGRMLLRLEDAIGRTPRRDLPSHAALGASALEMPVLVKRGERLSLASRTGGITVTATVEALGNGRMGEHIRVRNLQSQRVIEATVTGPGRAEVI